MLSITVASIVIAELVIHFTLDLTSIESREIFTLLDGAITFGIVFPFLYFFSFRPLTNHILQRKQVEQALRENQEFFRGIVEDQTELICRYTPQGDIRFINEAFRRYFSAGEDIQTGLNFFALFQPVDAGRLQHQLADLRPNQPVLTDVVGLPGENGHKRWLHWTVRGIFDGEGGLVVYQAVGTDITERERLMESLDQVRRELEVRVSERTGELRSANAALVAEVAVRKQTEEKLRIQSAALEAAANAVMISNLHGNVEWINPAFTQITGYQPEEIIGKNLKLLKSGWHTAEFYDRLWNTILSGKVWQGEIINRRKDGTLYPEEQTITPLFDDQGEISHFIAIKQDITQRKQAEDMEEHIRAQLQALSRRLVEIQENERKTIARELHDEASQALVYLKLAMDLLKEEATSPDAVVAGVTELERMLDNILGNLHQLAVTLRPASLDHLGLVAAIRQYAGSVQEKSGISVMMETNLEETRLPPDLEIALYRISQEALTNVIRHAKATQIEFHLIQEAGRVHAKICDNGIGFDPLTIGSTDRLGLFGMRERAEMFGGTIAIRSAPGAGTCIDIEVPYVH